MINTKAKQEVSNVEELFQQYIKLEHEDRGIFMSKVTNWLTSRIEADNKRRKELEINKHS